MARFPTDVSTLPISHDSIRVEELAQIRNWTGNFKGKSGNEIDDSITVYQWQPTQEDRRVRVSLISRKKDSTDYVEPQEVLAKIPWFSQAIEQDSRGEHVLALGIIFDWVEQMLERPTPRYHVVDFWLSTLKPSELSINLIGGILSITRPAAEYLPARQKFFEEGWAVTESRGRNAEKLYGGLKGRRSNGARA